MIGQTVFLKHPYNPALQSNCPRSFIYNLRALQNEDFYIRANGSGLDTKKLLLCVSDLFSFKLYIWMFVLPLVISTSS